MTANWTYAYVIAALAAVLSLVTVVSGLRLAPRWPTMSTRYDAPTTSVAETETDLWKALDAGRDPTDPRAASGP